MTTDRVRLHRVPEGDRAAARSLQRRHEAGELIRLARGVYTAASAWRDCNATERHLVLARAVAPTVRPTAAFSHSTAAIAYGWPLVSAPPARVHVTDGATRRTEHRAHLVRHAGEPETEQPPGSFAAVRVTSRIRTALDLATSLEPAVAAVAIDHAIRSGAFSIEEFVARLPTMPQRGSVRCRIVADALDPRHESAGESYTAVRMVELGLPRPIAQHEFRHPGGGVDRVDFWFAELGVVVEFDGRQKYTDRAMLDGREPGDALWQEKIREDRLRSLPEVRSLVRPTWWHLVDPERLRTLFRQHRVVF